MNWLEHTRTLVIDPSDVDLEDHTYYIPCFASLEPLIRSIDTIGLISPPLLQESAQGRMVPVLGRRRMMAVLEIGLRRMDSRIVSIDMPVADGFLLAFWENMGHRSLEQAAKAVVVRRLLELFPRPVVARDFLPALGIAPKGPLLERLQAIGALEYTILAELASGRIQDKTAEILSRLDSNDRSVSMSLMVQLGMNANRNAELISNLYDLSVTTGKSFTELLDNPHAASVVQDCQLPRSVKAERLRQLLRYWKFPELFRDQTGFDTWRKALSLPRGVTVRPSQSFEDPGCTIEVRTKSRDEANSILDRIFRAG